MESILKILLVEDNSGDADLIIELLSESKLKKSIIQHANNLRSALALLKKDTFDLVLLDLGLPDSLGLNGLNSISKIIVDIPVVIISGQEDLAISEDAIQQGAQDYLIKGKMDGEILTRIILYSIERTKQKREIKAKNQLLLASEEELRAANQELQILNSEKDKFFSIIAHDLKSPFNSIMGLCELLVKQVQENDFDDFEKYAKLILNSSQRTVDLLTNLMEWSRAQTGRMEFTPEYLKITDLTHETVDLLKPVAGQKSITLKDEISPKAIAFADKAMISTVIRNLISNAIKFTESGGEIVLRSHAKQNEITISVSDSGIGIPKDRIEKLFILSESNSTTGTNNEKGTGLGLILCKEFVEKNGGRIWVESKEGKSSTFYFTLPYNTVPTIENND